MTKQAAFAVTSVSHTMRKRIRRFDALLRHRWAIPLPGFILLAILTFPPVFYAFYLSFVNINLSLPDRAVEFVGLENYIQLFTSSAGQEALIVNLIITFGSTTLAVLVGFIVAYLIHEYSGRLAAAITTFVLIPLAVSPVAMALIFSLIINPLYGPLPQLIAMFGGPLIALTANSLSATLTIIFVQVWQWSPLAVVLILGGIKSVPEQTLEAARVDGSHKTELIWHIILPSIKPIIAITAIFEFILNSQVFAATKLLTNGGPGNATTTLSLYIYKIGISESSRVSDAAAVGVVALIIGVLSAIIWLAVMQWNNDYD